MAAGLFVFPDLCRGPDEILFPRRAHQVACGARFTLVLTGEFSFAGVTTAGAECGWEVLDLNGRP